jgi:uncharacterized protein YcfL
MRKIVIVLLAAFLLAGLVACKSQSQKDAQKANKACAAANAQPVMVISEDKG